VTPRVIPSSIVIPLSRCVWIVCFFPLACAFTRSLLSLPCRVPPPSSFSEQDGERSRVAAELVEVRSALEECTGEVNSLKQQLSTSQQAAAFAQEEAETQRGKAELWQEQAQVHEAKAMRGEELLSAAQEQAQVHEARAMRGEELLSAAQEQASQCVNEVEAERHACREVREELAEMRMTHEDVISELHRTTEEVSVAGG
jgi:chromosome segregation ATPase